MDISFTMPNREIAARIPRGNPRFLLVGPYDPMGGEYTFLAPPLGVWRLCGVLRQAGFRAEVFDPNCCDAPAPAAFARVLSAEPWDVIGFSTTGMTLRHDLELSHIAARHPSDALLIAGGMEATFNPESLFALGPYDLIVLGEGERSLLEIGRRLRAGEKLSKVPGTAFPDAGGRVHRLNQSALCREELRDAIMATPYEEMPFDVYWARMERSYRVHELPMKADREARLSELRAVRLNTLNYCPMNCTFCSSTNFLHSAQGGKTAKVGRLDADETLIMLERIVAAQPDVRTIIFQDDIFCFTKDSRILPLCENIRRAKRKGVLPRNLQFISTNRIDAMNEERLRAMRDAGFRVLGFGVESFSENILKEFNKAQIFPHIESTLSTALRLGITPFLDMILTSPRCGIQDLATNIHQILRWVEAGCEVGAYPYVIPFSGSQMAGDESLRAQTEHVTWQISGTPVVWTQPAKILPLDPLVRGTILAIEARFEHWLGRIQSVVPHAPSRLRSLLWVTCAIPELRYAGQQTPDAALAIDAIRRQLPENCVPKTNGVFASLAAAATDDPLDLSRTASFAAAVTG